MKKNVGSIDRVLRLLLGLAIIAIGFVYQSWWGVLGIIPLFTSAAGWCPVYMPFGISTCKTEPK
ncbi:MAG: DUF2892 domain-containing protein [Ignavibacteriales bacterium]|nr:DUF2892 domain-containing protein [Ignavibacteriales bacterium]